MAKKQETKSIVTQIVIKSPNRATSDVGTWRNAMRSADMGRVKTLYDLFDDLLIDGVLSDAIDKRIQAVTNSPITFQDAAGAEVHDIAKLIDTPAFEELLKTIMAPIFWGRSGGEFSFDTMLPDGSAGFTFVPIPQKHIKLENKSILINDSDETGILYENDDHLLILGSPRQFGLLLKTSPFAIYKRGGFGDYAQWLEIFGMPQRVGKYSSYDPQNRQLLENAMEAAGAAPWIVIPKETDVETTNSGTAGDGASYNDFRRACNEEILITVLGQTLTTMQNETGARSLGEVHQEVEAGKHRSDLRYVQRVLNYNVLPLLEKRGFPVKGGRFVFPESSEELSVSDIVQLSDILEIPAQFLHDKYSIPIPKDGDTIARRSSSSPFFPADPQPAKKKKTGGAEPEPVQNSDSGNWMIRALRFFAGAPRWGGASSNLSLIDVVKVFDVEKIVLKAIFDIFEAKGKTGNAAGISPELFGITNQVLQHAVQKTFAKAGDDWHKQNVEFAKQFQNNTAIFAAFKNHQQTVEIVKQLYNEDGSLRSFSAFKKEALKISEEYNKIWLRTEYNTATRSARMSVNWTKFQDTKHLYPNLEYIPSMSAKPRDIHRLLWHKVFAMDDPIWNVIMPPSDWNCKCGVRQTSAKVTPLPAGFILPDTPPEFRNNPGKSGEFVKLIATAYYKNTPEADRPEISNYALKQMGQ